MQRLLVSICLVGVSAFALPGSSGAESGYAVAPVLGHSMTIRLNDGNHCNLHVRAKRTGRQVDSAARYFCYNNATKRPLSKAIKIRIVNQAGEWFAPKKGLNTRTFTECDRYFCQAKLASIGNPRPGATPTGTATFHIYYSRILAFWIPPPGCDYATDPKGENSVRITCTIQDRS